MQLSTLFHAKFDISLEVKIFNKLIIFKLSNMLHSLWKILIVFVRACLA